MAQVENLTLVLTLASKEVMHMSWDPDRAVEHCERQMERQRAELQKREIVGRDTTEVRKRLRTLEAVRTAHEDERKRFRSGY